MTVPEVDTSSDRGDDGVDFDAIVIGAGVSGIYMLHRLLERGLKACAYEAGGGVGGTWYWNRYPGCRFDSESYTYAYSFSPEILREWSWSELFAPQAETERYFNFVVDKLDLRPRIKLNKRVASASYDEARNCWMLRTDDGEVATARMLFSAVGILSIPVSPNIPGVETFAGESCHTARWNAQTSFKGKRVAVIGTGATGVQIIQEAAKTASQVTVFQRTPNWCVPLNNAAIDDARMAEIKGSYDAIFARCKETPACFVHGPDPRSVFDVTPEEREAFFEKLYAEPGFAIAMANFRDITTDRNANALISDFVARKIRSRVKDAAVADKLIPKNHGFGTRRVPLETNYYEAYNQPNVTLIDVNETPILEIFPRGIRTSEAEFEFDIIVYATGFDAVTGAFDAMDITGVGGVALKDRWADGPATFGGIMVDGFPNLFMILGPSTALANFPRSAEFSVDWCSRLLDFAAARGATRIEAGHAVVEEWAAEVARSSQGNLSIEVRSWYSGGNTNLEGGQPLRAIRYLGGNVAFRAYCDAVADAGYAGISIR